MVKSIYKMQIVLEPEQHKALAEIVEREGRSIAEREERDERNFAILTGSGD